MHSQLAGLQCALQITLEDVTPLHLRIVHRFGPRGQPPIGRIQLSVDALASLQVAFTFLDPALELLKLARLNMEVLVHRRTTLLGAQSLDTY
jgi:hypothetical protein